MQFTKMQGVGNDFVVINAAEAAPEMDWTQTAVRLCARHVGVGADGLLVVAPPAPDNGGAGENEAGTRLTPPLLEAGGPAFAMRMFNPDGTEDMCGNGLRCVGLWAYRAGWLRGAAEFTIATKEGPKRASLVQVAGDGQSASLRVDMGRPHFAPSEIPFCGKQAGPVLFFPLRVGDRTSVISSMNTGSTHTVLFGDAPTEAEFQYYSPLIENHPLFPERTSVLWATPTARPNRFQVRIWERGVGETLGCGTGACAVGVTALLKGLASEDVPIEVVSKGGTLKIDWPGADASVLMTGPAQFVYDGEITLAHTV